MKIQSAKAGIGTGRAGLQAASGLFSSAGLFQKGVKSFHPNDLDPYLLFDAESSMIGTLENPTLDLDPSNPDSLDVITATRSSVATRTLSDGTIALAEQDTVRVDYTQGAELTPTKFQHFGQTEFDQWSHARTSETVNAITSPDGETNGAYFEQDTGNTNAGSIYKTFNGITGVYTASIYAKKKEKNFISFYDTNTVRTYFNLDTGAVGTVGSGHTAAIEDAGDGWFRCLVTFTASSGTLFGFYLADTDNSLVVTGGGGIYIYGPQLEEGTTASSFVANTSGNPKFITGPTFGPRSAMILVEPSATNLVTNSEDFNNVNGSTKTTGIVAPDGSNNAERFSGGTLINNVFANSKAASIATESAVEYVGSIYVRGTAGETVNVFMKRAGAGPSVTSGSLSVLLTGEWQRIENLSLTTDPANDGLRIFISSSSETADSVDLWGAQVEAGSVSTSVIPTSGGDAAARTRAADDLVISGSAFSNFFNGSEGTFYIEALHTRTLIDAAYISGQSSNQYFMYRNRSDNNLNSFDGGNADTVVNIPSDALFKAAVTYSTTNKTLSMDGTTASEGAINSNWAASNILNIGQGSDGQIGGHIKRLLFWPTHSSRL